MRTKSVKNIFRSVLRIEYRVQNRFLPKNKYLLPPRNFFSFTCWGIKKSFEEGINYTSPVNNMVSRRYQPRYHRYQTKYHRYQIDTRQAYAEIPQIPDRYQRYQIPPLKLMPNFTTMWEKNCMKGKSRSVTY